MRLHDYISNLITNSVSFESKYYKYNRGNLIILLYVRYNKISRNKKKLDENISDYL